MVRQSLADPRAAWRGAVAGLLAGALASAVFVLGWLQGPYDALQDKLFPAPAPSDLVTLVAVDQKSSEALGPFPWSNAINAQVITYLAGLKPKVLLFDLVLDHETGSDPKAPQVNSDDLLVTAITQARQNTTVILACTGDTHVRAQFAAAATAVADRGLGRNDAANSVRGVPLHPNPTCAENSAREPACVTALRAAGVSTAQR